MRALMEKLLTGAPLSCAEYAGLIEQWQDADAGALFAAARAACDGTYGKDVYLRGLIEVSNYCKNDCRYCGIRRSNTRAERYRLAPDEILDCCARGYARGLRTFVLQGGEDAWFTCERVESLVRQIKARYPDCAVTLSLGEHPKESYAAWRRAGADRYLLRHETADAAHYTRLHPAPLTLENRMRCLRQLREKVFVTTAPSSKLIQGPTSTVTSDSSLILYASWTCRVAPGFISASSFELSTPSTTV